MKKVLFFAAALLMIGCSKSEPKVEDDKVVKGELIFTTPSNNSISGYTVNSKGGAIFININPSKSYPTTFKVGDKIYMYLNGNSTSNTGRIKMELRIDDKTVKKSEGDISEKLEFEYTVSK